MELQFVITSVVIPIILGILTGGLGITFYNSRQDKKKKIAAEPIEQKKVELEATDRAIKNILSVQESLIQENVRLNSRIQETEQHVKASQEESDKKFGEIQSLLDDALKKLDAHRRYIQRVRRELAKNNIQMPEPDPQDVHIINS